MMAVVVAAHNRFDFSICERVCNVCWGQRKRTFVLGSIFGKETALIVEIMLTTADF